MRQTVKNFLGRTVLRKTGKGNSCWVQKGREQSGKNVGHFAVFGASEKFLIESFYTSMNYFIVLAPERSLHKFRDERESRLAGEA